MIEILFSSWFIFCAFTKVKCLVEVERRIRLGASRWSGPNSRFDSYTEFRAAYNYPAFTTLAIIALCTFLMTYTVTTTSIVIILYAALSNSLHVYIKKNESKFK